jgi:3-deoxy-D-manno-octulosonic-acid transferase
VFYYLYWVIATILYLVALPFLILFSFKKKYKNSIPSRFFLYKNSPLKEGGIHFHICSFGEAKSIKPIVDALPIDSLRFSATTNTGMQEIKKYSNQSRYLPFEIFLPFWIKRQKALVVVEAELWYMLFAQYRKKNAKSFLINARISSKSYPKYLKFKWFYRKIFKNIDVVYAQTKEDAKRLQTLGAKEVKVNGNIKFFNLPDATKKYPKRDSLVVCAASTHEGEEGLIIEAFLSLKNIEHNAQLIVVPRHPERFAKVEELLSTAAKEAELTFEKFSNSKEFATDLVLVDALGELVNIYAISDVVILGGAFEKIGGHNAAEAAKFGCKIISGEHYFNQKDIFKSIDGIKIVKSSKLKDTLLNYKELANTKIDSSAQIDELIAEIKSVL